MHKCQKASHSADQSQLIFNEKSSNKSYTNYIKMKRNESNVKTNMKM